MKITSILKAFPLLPIAVLAFTGWVLFTPATNDWVMAGEATPNGYGVLARVPLSLSCCSSKDQ